MEDIKIKIEVLRKEINKHNYCYYVLNTPIISDQEFDKKLKELEALEKQHPEFFDSNSPTQRVGSDSDNSFEKIKHKYPMLSLANTYSMEEFMDFDRRVKEGLVGVDDFLYVGELKFDGASISITYIDGKLHHAVTRGDGMQGDDVTENIKTIKSIPLEISGKNFPKEFEVRGEVIMPHDVFKKLNEERIECGEEPFANPRNAASGSLKNKKSSVVAKRGLDAYFYYFNSEEEIPNTHYQRLSTLEILGFKVHPTHDRLSSKVVGEFINHVDTIRKTLPFDIDGVVIKVDNIEYQKKLGFTSKVPKWGIAYKFAAEKATTNLIDIVYQTGRTGAITPVAILEPVQIAGTVVKRCSLYNEDYIQSLDLKLGDKVYVEKGGEIIPKVTGVLLEYRTGHEEKINYAKHCSECLSPLEKIDAIHYCINPECPAQRMGSIEHFVSRDAMNIEGLSTKTIETLFSKNFLPKGIQSLYNLCESKDSLCNIEGLGERSVSKLLEAIESTKNVPFNKVLYALGIRYVGKTTAKKLASHFKNIEAIKDASVDEIKSVEDVGDICANSVYDFFHHPKNIETIDFLKQKNLQLEILEDTKNTSEKLKGMTIVLSGTFEKSREELKELIEKNGGKNGSSVSKNTTYFLMGDNCGPSKMEKVNQLQVPIITEHQLMEMIS